MLFYTFHLLFLINLVFSQSNIPQGSLLERGDTFAIFNVTGNDTINGQKVIGLKVNYRLALESQTLSSLAEYDEESVIIDITNFGDLLNTYHAAVKVYNLKPGKHYFFSFISITKSGERSSPSREVPVNTLPSVPNVSWFRKDNGMLRVNWNNTDHADETDYTIIVAKNDSLNCGYSVTLAKCFGNSYTLTQLQPESVYRLEIFAQNFAGRSRSAIIFYPE